jgi:hypothetical protein
LPCAAQAPPPSSGPASGTQPARSGGLQAQLSRSQETPALDKALKMLQVNEVREEETVGQLGR